jgi:acyl-CoA thioester hydrolase
MHHNFFHRTPVQVRFKDIDKQGHVNNANHLTYIETARVSYFNQVLGPDVDWDKTGLLLAKTEIDYYIPIFLNDAIEVYTKVSRIGQKSFDVSNCIVKIVDQKITECASARSVFVCYDYLKKTTIAVPDQWKEKFITFENESPQPKH